MMQALTAMAECLMTGIVAGLVILGTAKLGWLPILLVVEQKEDEVE
jgi:hypothetical protein